MDFKTAWSLAKVAGRAIPWVRIAQHAPDVIDYFGQAKERRAAPQVSDLEERLDALQEQNEKLTEALVGASQEVQILSAALKTVASRVTLLAWLSALSLVVAGGALIVAFVH